MAVPSSSDMFLGLRDSLRRDTGIRWWGGAGWRLRGGEVMGPSATIALGDESKIRLVQLAMYGLKDTDRRGKVGGCDRDLLWKAARAARAMHICWCNRGMGPEFSPRPCTVDLLDKDGKTLIKISWASGGFYGGDTHYFYVFTGEMSCDAYTQLDAPKE